MVLTRINLYVYASYKIEYMTNVTDITTQVDVPAPDDDGRFKQQVQELSTDPR